MLPLCIGAWILTNGLRFGITKHLGQAVRDHSLASTSSKVRVVAIGIAPWNMIHNREALLTAKVFPYINRQCDANKSSVCQQIFTSSLLTGSFCIMFVFSRWTSLRRTSHRTCLTARCIPWTAITRTLCWWRKIPTDQEPPVK